MDYSDQISRIKRKLPLAAKADPGRAVFGAKSHNYRIGPPAREQDVQSLESRYSFQFPSYFRAFVTQVGNGGAKPKHAAAGPFYGINSLNDSAAHVSAQILTQPSLLQPEMIEAEWMEMDTEAQDIEDYDDDLLWRGLWPLGTQGCTCDHALILNGPERGRVVNLDGDSRRAIFTFENNFLDWYERWLDEVISGDLLQDGPCWFGYTMAGDADHLMRVFRAANNDVVRMNALEGLEKLRKASDLSCSELIEVCGAENIEIRHQALRVLTKFS